MIGGDPHPDPDTRCTFRRENQGLRQAAFGRGLALAQALQFWQGGQITGAVEGIKAWATASQHAAVSDEPAGKTIRQLDGEVKELLAKAEPADRPPLAEGWILPEAIQRRQARTAKLATARVAIEARAPARAAAAMAESQAQRKERAAPTAQGKQPRGPASKEPSQPPTPGAPYNFTVPERRRMQAGSGQPCEPSDHAAAAVAVARRLIVGERGRQAPNDKAPLVPTVAAVGPPGQSGAAVLTASGFDRAAAVPAVDQNAAGQPTGTTGYAAVEKTAPPAPSAIWKGKMPRARLPPAPAWGERMQHRLQTAVGNAKYQLRQPTVEPVWGIIQSVWGCRQLLLRGKEKVGLEWQWVCLADNFNRWHRMAPSFPAAG